jgi:hypothetical protein
MITPNVDFAASFPQSANQLTGKLLMKLPDNGELIASPSMAATASPLMETFGIPERWHTMDSTRAEGRRRNKP